MSSAKAVKYFRRVVNEGRELLRGTSLYSLSDNVLVEERLKPLASKLTAFDRLLTPLSLQPFLASISQDYKLLYLETRLKEIFTRFLSKSAVLFAANFLDMKFNGFLSQNGMNLLNNASLFIPQYAALSIFTTTYNYALSTFVPWEVASSDDPLHKLYHNHLLPKARHPLSDAIYEETALLLLPFFHEEVKQGPAPKSSRFLVAIYLLQLFPDALKR